MLGCFANHYVSDSMRTQKFCEQEGFTTYIEENDNTAVPNDCNAHCDPHIKTSVYRRLFKIVQYSLQRFYCVGVLISCIPIGCHLPL